MPSARQLLYPEPPRDFPGRRWVRTTSRTAHIIAFSILLGGHVFGASAEALLPWLYASIATGAALAATDLHQSFLWLGEVRGVAILGKLALLCVVPFWWEARIAILIAVVMVGSVVSHMPSRYRYWVIGRGPRLREGGKG
jgi:hypothetical protein